MKIKKGFPGRWQASPLPSTHGMANGQRVGATLAIALENTHDSLRLGLKTVLGRAYPRLVSNVRNFDWLFYEILLPLLQVSAYALVYRTLKAPQQYTGFVILGGAMSAFWLNVLWSMAAQLHWERQSGNLELYLMAPTSMLWILAGMSLGGMVATLIRAVAIVLVGSLLFGVTYHIVSLPALVLIFALTLVALYGLGCMLASLYLLYNREVWAVQEAIQQPVALITGFYFPIRTLGAFVGGIASLIPLTLGLDAMRQMLFPGGWLVFLPVGLEIALLVLLAVLLLICAAWSFSAIERRARIAGRLSLKWQ
jgi:ABC-2 type transport system permease protein